MPRTPITVAIPTHNRRETVLMAVQSAIEQTRQPEHVIVVADGCTDGTAEALRELGEPRVEVLELEKGPGYGYSHRNEAIRRAAGGAIAWLGDDDLYLPDHLERVGEQLDGGDVDIVQAMACVVFEDDRIEPLGMDWRLSRFRRQFLTGHNRTPMGAVSHRAEPALRAGGFNDDLPRRNDRDLWQRMLRDGARSTMLVTPTLLHFRGSGRGQSSEERMAQNAEALRRLRDPTELARLRSRLALAVHAQGAETMSYSRRAWWWLRTVAAR